MKSGLKLYAGLLVLLLVIPLVKALGVSAPYWDNHPLMMYPGEIKEFSFGLQNMMGEDDLLLKAEITSGEDIAMLVDQNPEYLVPLGSANVPVRVKVAIPEDASLGLEQMISLSIKTIPLERKGMLQISTELLKKVPVIIKSKEEISGEPSQEQIEFGQKEEEKQPLPTGLVISLLAVLVTAGVVIFIFRRKKKQA